MSEFVNVKMWTMCMIQDGDKILLIDRKHGNFQGFIPPGGKVDFPESIVDGAIREVREETGLEVSNLVYKGLYEYVNPESKDRYMIFNYITRDFRGDLLEVPPEGKLVWINMSDVDQLPMQKSVRRRFPLFFEERTFEIQVEWDQKKDEEGKVKIRKT